MEMPSPFVETAHLPFAIHSRYEMFLLGNKFYIVFISIWVIGLYFIFTTFHTSSTADKLSENRLEILQNEVDSLRLKIRQIQSDSRDASQSDRCQKVNEELTRVKRQLQRQEAGHSNPQRTYFNRTVHRIARHVSNSRGSCARIRTAAPKDRASST